MNPIKYNKYNLILECVKLRKDIRFQVCDSYIKNLEHRTFKELKDKNILSILIHCNQILRYSIESENISEYRIDIDSTLEEGLKYAKIINEKLSKDNIKIDWYYSGGKGVHGSFLFNLENIATKNSKININIDELNFEFRNKNSNVFKPNLELIELRNKERTQIRKLISKYYNITKYHDPQLFSSQIMFGIEGGRHRKTNNIKHLIDITKPINEILEYIEEIKNTKESDLTKFNITNLNYFNEIQKLSKECENYVNENLKVTQINPENKIVMNKGLTNQKRIDTKQNFNDVTRKLEFYVIALIHLYKKHNITSQHNYIFYLLKLFNDLTNDKEKTIKYTQLIISSLNLTNKDNIENQYKFIKNNTNKVYRGFKQGERGGIKSSYTELELETYVNKLYLGI